MHSTTSHAAIARGTNSVKLESTKPDLSAIAAKEMWTHNDLVVLGYASDRATTRRRIARGDFPAPVIMSSNSISWVASEVRQSIANRPRGLAPQPQRPPRQPKSKAPVTLPGRSSQVSK